MIKIRYGCSDFFIMINQLIQINSRHNHPADRQLLSK